MASRPGIGQLEKLHEQDQRTHQQDQLTIQQLQQRLGETQTLATNADQKAKAAARIQPIHPIASGAMSAMHNFTMAGDAEVQFGRSQGQHSGFVLADFAPIFLYRANDNMLFEAGFNVTLQNNTDPITGNPNGGSRRSVDLSFAQLDYLLNDYVTIVAGDMVLPLGTYSERAAGWLNKIPDDPLARGSPAGQWHRRPVAGRCAGRTVRADRSRIPFMASTDRRQRMEPAARGSWISAGTLVTRRNCTAIPAGGAASAGFIRGKRITTSSWGFPASRIMGQRRGTGCGRRAVLDAALHISPCFEVKGEYINAWVQTNDYGDSASEWRVDSSGLQTGGTEFGSCPS